LDQSIKTDANSDRLLSPNAVELLFWGGVLVILGYLFHYQPEGGEHVALRIAPHARLGRMLLLVGGAYAYGSLRDNRLLPQAVFLLALCILQVLLMAAGWVLVTFDISPDDLLQPAMVARGRSVALGVDLAIILALLLLLRRAGRASRPGFILGASFFGSASALSLVAPLVLPDRFWLAVPDWPASVAAQSPAMGLQVSLAVFSLIVLIKLYRLVHSRPRAG
jgi:hypothetical protein